MNETSEVSRRPIASRSSAWANWLARCAVASGITPNQISVLSVVFAVAAAALTMTGHWAALLGAALCILARLICNLIDGMVAIEGGKGGPTGAVFNELPDRISDAMILVAFGYAAGIGWAGWLAALLAVICAYIRALGGTLSLSQDFSGVMDKSKRMAAAMVGLVAQAGELWLQDTRYSMTAAIAVIALGTAVTCMTRTHRMLRRLEEG